MSYGVVAVCFAAQVTSDVATIQLLIEEFLSFRGSFRDQYVFGGARFVGFSVPVSRHLVRVESLYARVFEGHWGTPASTRHIDSNFVDEVPRAHEYQDVVMTGLRQIVQCWQKRVRENKGYAATANAAQNCT